MHAIFLFLALFTGQAIALDDVDSFNPENFLFGKRSMSAVVFKRGTYFIHLIEIRSESFKSKSNPNGYYLFQSDDSLKTGDAFCKSILKPGRTLGISTNFMIRKDMTSKS